MATHQIGFADTPNTSISASAVAYRTTLNTSNSMVAPASGTCTTMYVYKATTADLSITVGIYDSSLNLLVSQSTTVTGAIGWHSITITGTTITSGNTYYPAVLLNTGNTGTIGYDTTDGNDCSRSSLSALPDPWVDPKNRDYCFGVYLEYDDSGGTTYNVSVTEAIGLSDAQLINIDIAATVSETINLTDLEEAVLEFNETVSESISINETLSTITQYAVNIVESIALSEAFSSGSLAIGKISVTMTGIKPKITLSSIKPEIGITAIKPQITIEGADST